MPGSIHEPHGLVPSYVPCGVSYGVPCCVRHIMQQTELEACSIWDAFDVVLWLVTAWQVSSSANHGADCTMSSKRSVGGHVQVAYWMHARCIAASYQVHAKCMPDSSQVHTLSRPGAYQPCAECIPGAYQIQARCIPNAHQVHTNCTPGAHQVHTRR